MLGMSDKSPATEIPSKTRKIRRYARITAIVGAGISAASLILALIPVLLVCIVITVLSTMLFVVTKPKGATKATEFPPQIQKMRRCAKYGLLTAVASSILQFLGNSLHAGPEPTPPYAFPFLHENQILLAAGILAGILIAFASTTARILMEPAATELRIRKLPGLLLGYSSLTLLLLTVGFFGPISPIVGFLIPLLLGFHWLRSKRSRLTGDVLWILLSLFLYAFLPPAVATSLKGVLLATDWSDLFNQISIIGVFNIVLMLGSAIFLLVVDVLARTERFAKSTKKGRISLLVFLMILAALFGAPLSRSVGVRPGPATSLSGLIIPFNTQLINASVNFDSENDLWIYQFSAKNSLDRDAEIIEVSAQKQPSSYFMLISEKWKIAPPFGGNIEVAGGEKTSEKIVVNPGSTVTLKISSKDPLLSIALTVKEGRYDISFWSILS